MMTRVARPFLKEGWSIANMIASVSAQILKTLNQPGVQVWPTKNRRKCFICTQTLQSSD